VGVRVGVWVGAFWGCPASATCLYSKRMSAESGHKVIIFFYC